MKKAIEIIKTYWKDPVWSKVIAAGIIFVLGSISTGLYSIFKNLYSQISFKDTFKGIWDFLIADIVLTRWVLLVFFALYLILILKPLISFIKEVIVKARTHKKKLEKQNTEIPIATEHSTVLFSYRMAKAFPGIRNVTWFNDPIEARKRLEILLKKPLRFQSGSRECESDPIWWFRGGSALYIERFQKIGRKKALMNINQLKIKRIAAYHGDSYYKDFVYVEAEGEKQTGLYELTKEDIKRHIETFGYSWEEYGLIDYLFFWKKPIRREDYDDGATVIRGKVIDAHDAELRVRYLSDYNFIIAAKGSPYNSHKFDRSSKDYLNGILAGNVQSETFFDFLKIFHKHEE